MRKFIKSTSILLLALIASLILINQVIMINLKTEIVIEASTEKVWSVLMDHNAYSSWNPFITKIEGSPEVGNQLEVSLTSPGRILCSFNQ